MSAKPWVISVLSTDYDLHEHRQAIIAELQKKNVRVSAFELPDFPVEVDIHSHDSCLIALDRIDIALLVIDKRYGIYIGDSKCSITETEYLTVVKSKKPCLVFVSKQAWDEWHTYKVGLKSWTDTHSYTQFDEESGKLESGKTLDSKIKRTLENDNSILVYGEAGYGKTTILAKSFLSHVKAFFQKGSYQIPFYLWLKEKNSKYHFDFLTYINESFVDDWKREPYPYLNLKDIRPYFYFDGFDEIGEKMTPDEVAKISQADIFTYPILLTCRQQFAFRYINSVNFSEQWVGTLRAFLRHFKSENVEHYYLRRIDLVTMKHFIVARGFVEPLTSDIMDELAQLSVIFSRVHLYANSMYSYPFVGYLCKFCFYSILTFYSP